MEPLGVAAGAVHQQGQRRAQITGETGAGHGFASQVQRFGLAAAASVTLGMVLLVATLIQLRVGRGTERHLA